MLIESTWTVTLGGVTLLERTDCFTQGEPSIVPVGVVDQVQYLRAAFGSQRGRGGVRHTVSFSRMKLCADSAAAQAFLIAHVRALPLCAAPDTLEITLADGTGYRLAEAVLTSAGTPTTESERFLAQYTIIGGELSALPMAEPEVDESGDHEVTEGGDQHITE